ncbi:MAG: M24 family metallopeptidase [Pirellulales bacterium]
MPAIRTTRRERSDAAIEQGDLVLVDLWCKVDHPRGVYSDLTRMGYMGATVPTKFADLFTIVAHAHDAAVKLVEDRFAAKQELRGWEVDEACRKVIVDAGYGQAFVHRTGHSIGFTTHGDGANMDNLETHDDRLVLAGTCFSIEPGIYLPDDGMGFRSEINILITRDGKPQVKGGLQREIVPILK